MSDLTAGHERHSSANVFDSVEVIPSQRNFGTITFQKRPSIHQLHIGNLSKIFQKHSSSHISVNENDIAMENDNNDTDDHEQSPLGSHNKSNKFGHPRLDRQNSSPVVQTPSSSHKFGTFDGVLARCLLCIWGVIMYLRTGWIVGHAGVWQTTIIMCLAASVTTLTSLSLSAICTNGDVKAGGYYFLISRSLGPEFGGVIGILFAFANCISVAMYLTGFAETVVSLYDEQITGQYDIQLWAEIVLVFLLLVSFRGVGSVIKFDMVLLVVLVISLIIFFIGTFTRKPTSSMEFTGYSSSTFGENWNSAYKSGHGFVSVFSVFFPAVTGEMAGANISGDLKNPSYSIPVGTLSAIVLSTFVYVVLAWVLGATISRAGTDCDINNGLYCDYMVMAKVSLWAPLVIAGIFASTLSSGLSCFVGAPRIFQAVCQDNLFPSLSYFGKSREKDGEPVRAYFVAFVISFVAILSGNINFIAPIITNFFLVTYALMNYSCFAWSLTKSPGWRPTFKFYHPWISLVAAAECIALMFLIDWMMALITVIIGLIMYKYVSYIEPNVHWGTAAEAMTYMTTCKNLLKYQAIKPHAKVERPTFLLFNVNESQVREMFDLATVLNYARGLIMIGDIVVGDRHDPTVVNRFIHRRRDHEWDNLPDEIAKNSVVETCIAPTFVDGISTILQTAGVGAIRPNVVLFKMMENYKPTDKHKDKDKDEEDNHFNNINNGIHQNLSRVKTHSISELQEIGNNQNENKNNDLRTIEQEKQESDKTTTTRQLKNIINEDRETSPSLSHSKSSRSGNVTHWGDDAQPDWMEGLHSALTTGCGVVMVKGDINWTKTRESNAFIDIWWLYDDGGLTVLIPYLLQKSPQWQNCQLRIMALENMGLQDQQELITLMSRLRIDAEVVNVKTDISVASISHIPRDTLNIEIKLDKKSENKPDDDVPTVETDHTTERNTNSKVDTNTLKLDTSLHNTDGEGDEREISTPLMPDNDNAIDKNKSASNSSGMGLHAKSMGDDFGNKNISNVENIDQEYGSTMSKFAKKKLQKYRKLGRLIEQSRNSELCIVTMPFPRSEYSWFEYEQIIDALSPTNMSMMFVRGNQNQVLTFAL